MAADKQVAPHDIALPPGEGSMREAETAILGLLDPEKETPETEEAKPSEEVSEGEPEASEEEPEVEEETEDEEEESPEEEETEEEVDTPTVYSVKINGEDHEVTEDELIKGYSRQADYTKKTQELSQYRSQLDQAAQFYQTEVAATQEARQQYINSLAQGVQLSLSSLQEFENIDWERLKTEDKEEYLTKRDDFREAQNSVQKLKQTHAQEAERQNAEQQQQFQNWAQTEHQKLVSILPDWGDAAKQKAIAGELRQFAFTKGFAEEELAQLFDHRSILILMQAKAWEDDQKKVKTVKSKKIKNKPKVTRSGKGVQKSDSDKSKRAAQMKRLQETGHHRDAVSLLEDFVELE
tara:strand:+ start:1872 stop:2924 length:1053 start_codon:yes stop_codon:yes gene_type:complete